MRAHSRWLIAGLVCLVVFALLAVFKYVQIQAGIAAGNAYPEPAESVEAVRAPVGTFERSFSTIGEIVSPRSLELRNEVEGRIAAVNFASGERVDEGQVLVQLDVSEERARLAAARARADLAKLELDRARRLAEQDSVSKEVVDRAEADYEIAKADIQALEAIIGKKTLRAPFDARTGIQDLDPGEFLQANSALVNLVGISDHTWVEFNMPQDRDTVGVGSEVEIQWPGRENGTVSAEVIAREVAVSPSSRNLRLRARIDNPPELPPNTVVNVRVPLGTTEHIRLPRTALLMDDRGEHVFVLEENDGGEGYRARRRAVEVGDRNSEFFTVVSGLQAGELVAVHGAFKLYPGVLTRVRTRSEVTDGNAE